MTYLDHGYNHSYKRMILKDNPLLICPSCKGKSFKKFSYAPLVFYSTDCKICNTPIGFVKGEVKARKLGSYIRLVGENNKQISIDISLFGGDFDVRKNDNVTLLYQLNVSKKRPVMLINHTINDVYYLFAHEFGNPNVIFDLTKLFGNEEFKEEEKCFPVIEFINIDLKADTIWEGVNN